MAALKAHPAAELFPMLSEQALKEMGADIKTNGQKHPIVLLDGMILDGRNRYAACKIARVVPKFENAPAAARADPISYVMSSNVHRRHLDESQRAMVGARAMEMYKADAAARVAAGAKKGGAAAKAKRKGEEQPPAKVPPPKVRENESREKAAKLVKVSPRIVQHAVTVKDKGAPELVRAVEQGTIAVTAASKLVTASPEKQREIVARVESGQLKASKVVGDLKRSVKTALAAKLRQEPLQRPDGKFRVIVTDPPWPYENRSDDDTHRGTISYPPMEVPEICALPVKELAHEDCILFLWVTNGFMRHAYTCLDAWGFTEKTILTWDKEDMGLGDYLRNVTEQCVLAVRGSPLLELTNQKTLITEKRREHSRKPEKFYALVESLCPGNKLEMFARAPREGWVPWGAETEKFATPKKELVF